MKKLFDVFIILIGVALLLIWYFKIIPFQILPGILGITLVFFGIIDLVKNK